MEHQRLRRAYPRLGNIDLKIVVIVLTNNAILLTRNESDFGQIVGLQTEHWTTALSKQERLCYGNTGNSCEVRSPLGVRAIV